MQIHVEKNPTFKSDKQDFKRNSSISLFGEFLKLIQVGTSFAELHLAADLTFLVFLLDKEKTVNHPTAFPQNIFYTPALVALTRETG